MIPVSSPQLTTKVVGVEVGLGTGKEVRRFQEKPEEKGHVGWGGQCFKAVSRDGYTVAIAAETKGWDRLVCLELREVSVDLWEQKADREVSKKVEWGRADSHEYGSTPFKSGN